MENNHANKSMTVDRTNDQAPFQRGALIVDDDNLLHLMLRLALERDGFQVWVAANGYGLPNIYLSLLRHICTNGAVSYQV
jgi:hypothetical protein